MATAGTGLVTLRLAPSVRELVAADVSPKMLEVLAEKLAQGQVPNVRTLCWDVEQVDCPESGFDVVVSSMALHHVRDTDLLFCRLRRVLATGGWVALADLDTEDGTFHADPTGVHHHGFDRAETCRRIEAAGFTGVAAHDAHVVRRPGRSGELAFSVFLVVGRAAG